VVVNFADAKLLLEYVKLQQEVTEDKGLLLQEQAGLVGEPRISLKRTIAAKGYRTLRATVERMSPRAKDGFLRDLRQQISAVRMLLKRCAETGEKRPSLADLDVAIRMTEVETVQPADGRCTGSGAGITEPVDERIGCQRCMASWHQGEIGFRIPVHQEQK